MSPEIINVIFVVISAVLAAFLFYQRFKNNLVGAIAELVTIAEEYDIPGHEKMAQVVDVLYSKIPSWLRSFFTKAYLEKITQQIFDWMRNYAKIYAETASNNLPVDSSGTEEIAELVAQLMNAGLKELHDLAVEKCILTDDLKTKKDYVQAIIKAVLNKA